MIRKLKSFVKKEKEREIHPEVLDLWVAEICCDEVRVAYTSTGIEGNLEITPAPKKKGADLLAEIPYV